MLIRTDSLGVLRWAQFYNTNATVEAQSCLALADGGALLVVSRDDPAATFGNPIRVPTVLRVDSLGTVVWQRTYGQPYDSFRNIVALPNGSYALVGEKVQRLTNPVRFVSDPWLVRLDPNGDTIRTRVLHVPQTSGRGYNLRLTPAGTLVLVGSVYLPAQPNLPQQGLLLQLDAQDHIDWYQLVTAPRPTQNTGCSFYQVYPLPTAGQYLVAGTRSGLNPDAEGYLARYEHQAGGGTTPAWEVQFLKVDGYERPNAYLLEADHTLTVADWGNLRDPFGDTDVLVTRFAGLPPVYEPDLCATPPVPNTAYVIPPSAPDSLTLYELGDPGPAYAQLLHWRWSLGDGTVVAQTQQGPLRHRYAQVPVAGTPVTVTITNNLGCAASQTLYPWGQPTATQQAQALAAQASVFPNPAGGGQVTVRLPGLRAQAPVAGEALDALGRVVARFALPVRAGVAEGPVGVSGWPAGVYVLRLHPLEGPLTKRLVKP
jgi:hypothetical protein